MPFTKFPQAAAPLRGLYIGQGRKLTAQSGRSASAFHGDFTNTDASIVSTGVNFTTPATFTVEMWYKPNTRPTASVMHFLAGEFGADEESQWKWYVSYDWNGASECRVNIRTEPDNNGARQCRVYFPQMLNANYPLGEWIHFAFTIVSDSGKSGSDGDAFKLWVNGSDFGAYTVITDDTTDWVSSSPGMSIGAGWDSAWGWDADGYFDEIRLWSGQRTDAEIAANYQKVVTSGPGLLGSWGLESSLADESDNGNDMATHHAAISYTAGGAF